MVIYTDGRPSQKKERVLNTWRLLAQDELSLSVLLMKASMTYLSFFISKMCRTCFESYGKLD